MELPSLAYAVPEGNAVPGPPSLIIGTGSPAGEVIAPPGSLFVDLTAAQLWIKQTGTAVAGWVLSSGGGGGGSELAGAVTFEDAATPATLGPGTTSNYAPDLTDVSRLRISASGPATITGLAGGTDGRYLQIVNVGAEDITLAAETTSTAANRFAFNGDQILAANQSIAVIYDAGVQRWTVA